MAPEQRWALRCCTERKAERGDLDASEEGGEESFVLFMNFEMGEKQNRRKL